MHAQVLTQAEASSCTRGHGAEQEFLLLQTWISPSLLPSTFSKISANRRNRTTEILYGSQLLTLRAAGCMKDRSAQDVHTRHTKPHAQYNILCSHFCLRNPKGKHGNLALKRKKKKSSDQQFSLLLGRSVPEEQPHWHHSCTRLHSTNQAAQPLKDK